MFSFLIVEASSILTLQIKSGDECLEFRVYEKEQVDENTIRLYGKSKPNAVLDSVTIDETKVILHLKNDKIVIIENKQLYNRLKDCFNEIPNKLK